MDMLLKSSIFNAPTCNSGVKSLYLVPSNRQMRMPMKILQRNNQYPFRLALNCVGRCNYRNYINSRHREKETDLFVGRAGLEFVGKDSESLSDENAVSGVNLEFVRELIKRGIVLAAMVFGVLVFGCKRVFAMEGAADAGYGVSGQSILLLRNAWVLQALWMEIGMKCVWDLRRSLTLNRHLLSSKNWDELAQWRFYFESSIFVSKQTRFGCSLNHCPKDHCASGHKKKTAVIVVASIEVVSGMLIVVNSDCQNSTLKSRLGDCGTDGCLLRGFTLSEVLCCTHVCLLCVQQQPEDKPKETGFFIAQYSHDAYSSLSKRESCIHVHPIK
nr:putative duf21 domain-containing protein, chloroplastic [Quercus suber]